MLPARHRLRTSADFASAVRGRGAGRSGGRLLVVHATSNDVSPGSPSRVGFVVSKAVGGAVTRNRTKRVLRHLMADRMAVLPEGYDVVVRAQAAAGQASTPELQVALERSLPAALAKVRTTRRTPVSEPVPS